MDSNPPWWFVPITVIPGIGLLILSTSARYLAIGEQMGRLAAQPDGDTAHADHLLNRGSCLQQALFAPYLALTLFAGSSVLMALLGADRMNAEHVGS
ncbi:MAG: DUF2721 domain-containing protein [Limisphaerales bacterium]